MAAEQEATLIECWVQDKLIFNGIVTNVSMEYGITRFTSGEHDYSTTAACFAKHNMDERLIEQREYR